MKTSTHVDALFRLLQVVGNRAVRPPRPPRWRRLTRSSPTSPSSTQIIEAVGSGTDEVEARQIVVGAYRDNDAFVDLCPARTCHRPTARSLQASSFLGSVLARGRETPAAATHLRDRVGVEKEARRISPHVEEAEKRDHRKLGAELDLFSFPEDSSGSGHVSPQGGPIRKLMEDYSATHVEAGYAFVTDHASPRARCTKSRATSTGTPTACFRRWRSTARRNITSSR